MGCFLLHSCLVLRHWSTSTLGSWEVSVASEISSHSLGPWIPGPESNLFQQKLLDPKALMKRFLKLFNSLWKSVLSLREKKVMSFITKPSRAFVIAPCFWRKGPSQVMLAVVCGSAFSLMVMFLPWASLSTRCSRERWYKCQPQKLPNSFWAPTHSSHYPRLWCSREQGPCCIAMTAKRFQDWGCCKLVSSPPDLTLRGPCSVWELSTPTPRNCRAWGPRLWISKC